MTLREHIVLIESLAALEQPLSHAIAMCAKTLAGELVGRLQGERQALAAIALTTDSSALTAIATDYGCEQVFARQVAGPRRPGDTLIAISTSGQSPSVMQAEQMARASGMGTVGLSGKGGGMLAPACDLAMVVPSDVHTGPELRREDEQAADGVFADLQDCLRAWLSRGLP